MDSIDYFLAQQIQAHKTPSAQYLLFDKDRIIHAFRDGFADIGKGKKVTAKTTYNLYSITKTFTALAILQLAERKKVDLDAPAKKYLSTFPYSSQITVRQLLSHSAGIANPIPLNWFHLAEAHQTFDRAVFFKKIFAANKHIKSKPNQRYAYSNLGYVLLGELIEAISGNRYEDYIHQNILHPLGIEESKMGFTIAAPHQHAKGYHQKCCLSGLVLGFMLDKSTWANRVEKGWNAFHHIYVNGAAYGGLIGNASSLVTYLQELLKPNCLLISDQYKRQLFSENFTTQRKATGMCLSWFTGKLNGTTRTVVTLAGVAAIIVKSVCIPKKAWVVWCYLTGRECVMSDF